MHSAHTRAPRSALYDFHDPNRSRSKKSFNKTKCRQSYSIFFYMKNLKNQITLVIIKYSVYAFKCAENLIIMSLLLI